MLLLHVLSLVLLACCASAAPSGRVVNGTDSAIETYPFMISLRGSKGSHSCGGSIVAPYFALTAAHCTAGRSANTLSVQYGVTNIDAAGPNVVRVKRIIQHADYDPSQWYINDISLLEVDEPFILDGKTAAAVSLPALNWDTPQVDEGSPGVLAGWGLNETGGVIMKHLQEVNLKIYSDEECAQRHEGRVTKKQICGGVDEGGKGQCSGDSGGPLLYTGENSLVQVGIVSWSIKPCTIAPYPGVYTKVSNYVDWIKQNLILPA